jgi:hypothetical protein
MGIRNCAFALSWLIATIGCTSDALAASGRVFGWGDRLPAALMGEDGTTAQFALRSYGGCGIQAGTGAVFCWRDDDSGQATPPASVDGTAGGATAIAVNEDTSCAVRAGTGEVVCWGGQTSILTSPDSVNGTSGTATGLTMGSGHACAIQAGTGIVVCWGSDYGGLGIPPAEVNGVLGTATRIASHPFRRQTCAIRAGTGAAVCWGPGEGLLPPYDGRFP